VNPSEKGRKQAVRFNISMHIASRGPYRLDDIGDTVSYSDIVKSIRALANEGHFKLVEVVAERVAEICLRDERIRRTCVTVEKLDVYKDAEGVGITIRR
jgi:dihydroneopterin aldolase